MSISPDMPDLTATEPDLDVDGRSVYFVWNPPRAMIVRLTEEGTIHPARLPSIPKGALIHHVKADDGSPCVAWLAWARDPSDTSGPTWTLLSLDPLSIAEPFMCSRCGGRGGIREGRWWAALV